MLVKHLNSLRVSNLFPVSTTTIVSWPFVMEPVKVSYREGWSGKATGLCLQWLTSEAVLEFGTLTALPISPTPPLALGKSGVFTIVNDVTFMPSLSQNKWINAVVCTSQKCSRRVRQTWWRTGRNRRQPSQSCPLNAQWNQLVGSLCSQWPHLSGENLIQWFPLIKKNLWHTLFSFL